VTRAGHVFTAVAAARTTTESPEGRTENSPGLQAWEGRARRTRPEAEGASESGLVATRRYVVICIPRTSSLSQIVHTDFFGKAPHSAAFRAILFGTPSQA
jgi:hypothetical protein